MLVKGPRALSQRGWVVPDGVVVDMSRPLAKMAKLRENPLTVLLAVRQ
jgi:hypothetical protein